MTTSTTEQSTDLHLLQKIEAEATCSTAEAKLVEIHNQSIDRYNEGAALIKQHSDMVKMLYEELKKLETQIKDLKPIVSKFKKTNT